MIDPESVSPPDATEEAEAAEGLRALVRLAFTDSLARGAAATLVLKVAEAGATVVMAVILARMLGAAGFGVYAYVIAWANLLAVPGLFGMENLSVRHLSGYQAQADWGRMAGFIRFAVGSTVVASLLLALGASAIALLLGGGPEPGVVAFWVAMLLVPMLSMLRALQGMLRGLHFVVLGRVAELAVLPVVAFALIGVGYVVLGDRFEALTAIGIQAVATLAALGVAVTLLRPRLPAALATAAATYDRRAWVRAAIPLLFISGSQVINRQTDVIMLGSMAGDAAAGVYSVATRSAGLIGFVLFAVNAALAPRIARMYVRGEMTRLQRIATRSARITLIFSVPMTLAFALFGGFFMGIFGEEFVPGASALAILSVGQLINASTGSVGSLLTMTGHERDAARGFAISAVVNIVLNAILIPPFGLEGAAVSTGTSIVVWNVLLAIAVYRRLGIHSTALGTIRWPFR